MKTEMFRQTLLAVSTACLCLCGCVALSGEDAGGISMEEWCDRDESMPWTGCWKELAQLDCETGQQIEPAEEIEEFRLTSEGKFSVTWSAFEFYVDYAGSYEIDEKDGTITLSMGGNAPLNVDGQGNITITEGGELLLEDMWLGARYPDNATQACGHIFR
jgi:hypothetical protein